jgi:hypothetical protein
VPRAALAAGRKLLASSGILDDLTLLRSLHAPGAARRPPPCRETNTGPPPVVDGRASRAPAAAASSRVLSRRARARAARPHSAASHSLGRAAASPLFSARFADETATRRAERNASLANSLRYDPEDRLSGSRALYRAGAAPSRYAPTRPRPRPHSRPPPARRRRARGRDDFGAPPPPLSPLFPPVLSGRVSSLFPY